MKDSRQPSGCVVLLPAAEWSAVGTSPLRTIDERDLLRRIGSRELRRLNIAQPDVLQYRMHASLAVECNDVLLIAALGLFCELSTLDSLAKQIRWKYGSPAPIVIDAPAARRSNRSAQTQELRQ